MAEPREPLPDPEFVSELRATVDRYLHAVDLWEAAYQKYYRLPGFAGKVSNDLEEEHREYQRSRRALEAVVPRARGLCFRYGLRDPWAGLLRITLGQHAPQHRTISAVGRAERAAVGQCLVDLDAACRPGAEPGEPGTRMPDPDGRSWLRRIVEFFY
jgi:hypothetical protein